MSSAIKSLFDGGYFGPLEYRFAKSLGRIVPEVEPSVLLAAALVMQQTQAGHVCVSPARFGGKVVQSSEGKRFNDIKWPSPKKWLKAIGASSLVSDGSGGAPLVLDAAGRLYLHRYWAYQEALAHWFIERASAPAVPLDTDALAEGLNRLFGPRETLTQGAAAARDAAERACAKTVAIVTGGPGTGKTTLVMRILALLVELSVVRGERAPEIVAAAPTGKAAERLGEVLGKMAPEVSSDPGILAALPTDGMTIHRLLGVGAGPQPAVSADIVVVDEASMVDISLMHALVSRLRPSARLILLGDKDQLSSVESGAVFADICDAAASGGAEPIEAVTSKLTFSYRFDGHGGIGRLAEAIDRGNVDETQRILNADPSNQVRFVAETDTTAVERALTPLVIRYFGEALAESDPTLALLKFLRFCVLTPHRMGALGRDGINRFVETALYQQGIVDLRGTWYRGRPVMMTRNDYHLGLFNGDMGLTLPATGDATALSVYFAGRGGPTEKLPARLAAAETAFAMTVHRSQGSEFDHVAVVLPPKPSPILTRELLYTACTRARRALTIIGAEAVVRHAVEHPTQRASGLEDRLEALSRLRVDREGERE